MEISKILLEIKSSIVEKIDIDLVDEVKYELEECFHGLSMGLDKNSSREIVEWLTRIDHMISELIGYDFSENIFRDISSIISKEKARLTKIKLDSNNIFFVWIGKISVRSLKHILVWKKANPNYQITLWFDSSCLLAGSYRNYLNNYYANSDQNSADLIEIQNRIYRSLVVDIKNGYTFDDAIVKFFSKEDPDIAKKFIAEQSQIRLLYHRIGSFLQIMDVREHLSDIMDDECAFLYIREIALRANLACASDILRLNILYKLGGIYIDCDTLPNTNHIYLEINRFCETKGIHSVDLEVLKSELYFQKIIPFLDDVGFSEENRESEEIIDKEIDTIIRRSRSIYGDIVDTIISASDSITAAEAFRPLDDIYIYKDLLLVTADNVHRYDINNNVMIAHPRSKFVGIIISEMKRRYRYLEKMNAIGIDNASPLVSNESYYARLLNYRLDTLDGNANTTIILTGPGLILELLLGIGFTLFRFEDRISPISFSKSLYSSVFGIGFSDQSSHTLDHTKSTWMDR